MGNEMIKDFKEELYIDFGYKHIDTIDAFVEQLAKLYKSSILTPFNLVQYLKLDDYIRMEINKNDENNRLIAKISFLINKKEKWMYYEFDYEDRLVEAYGLDENNKKEYVYNRKDEVKKLINKINSTDIKR